MTTPIEIAKLLAPGSVAIVGASPERHYSRSIIANLRMHGFAETAIYPVNPRYQEIDGLPCYPSLSQLPAPVEAVAILVGKKAAAPLLREAAGLGVRGALVIADGYAEESAAGLAEQHALGDIARAADLALLGPNTLGYVIPGSGAGMWCAGALPTPLQPGGVALLAQSSGMLNLFMALAGQRLLGVRACVSVGNAEVLGMPELVSHFARDPQTTVLGLVIESVDRPRDLLRALNLAREAGKPVVVLKIGVSELGRQNSVAHTGRMAGPEQGWSALFDRLNVCAARDLDDMMETLTLFGGIAPALPDRALRDGRLGVALATISGGETSLICDIAAQEGLAVAELRPDTLAGLRTALNKPSMIGNPLDLQNTRTSRPEVFWQGLRSVCADENVDLLAVRFNFAERPTPALESMYREVVTIARAAGTIPLVLARAYERLDGSWWQLFAELQVPFVLSYRNSVRGLAAFSRWLSRRSETIEEPGSVPVLANTGPEAGRALSPAETVRWLERAGVPYVRSETVDNPAAAARAAAELGWPVVLKAVAPGLVHKSEAGGVVLNLDSAEAVEAAAEKMAVDVSSALDIEPALVRFEVQQLLAGGVEMILGMVPDPTWGPIVMIGAGGIFAETTGDTAWDLPPLSPERAEQLLRRLKIWPVLDGARNQPRSDTAALVRAIVAFSQAMVRDGAELAAVDLNPVLVAPAGGGVRAVDAAILTRAEQANEGNPTA